MPGNGTGTLGSWSLLSNPVLKMVSEVLLHGTDTPHREVCGLHQVVTWWVRRYLRVSVHKTHTEESGVEPDSRVTDLLRYPNFTEGDTETPQKEKCFFFSSV